MALGAERSSVYRLILKEVAWLITVGIATGLGLSVAAATLVRGMLFGAHSWDVPTLGGVAIVFGIPALAASFFPARRAASVNPVQTPCAE